MHIIEQFKYLMIGILLLLIPAGLVIVDRFLISQPSSPISAAVDGVTYYARFPASITLDGQFSDWKGIPYSEVTDGPVPAASPEDNALRFAAAADNQNLYFSVLVTDKHIVAGKHDTQYWNEDSVEIYINATHDLTLTRYISGVAQITIPAINIGLPTEQEIISGINVDNLGVRAVTVATEDGYAVEAAIPLMTDAWNIIPRDGTNIGFQIQLNSASETDRDVKLGWSAADKTDDQSYANPSVFGQLIFAQTDYSDLPTAAPIVESSPIDPDSNFTVQDSKIYDPQGHEFIAKGVNVNGSNWVWPRKTVDDIDLISSCWKFNLIRVNSFLFTGEQPYAQYSNNNNLDEIVNAFTSRGIVVVLEAHDRIGTYYQGDDLTTLVAWFTGLAQQYKNNPYVWFDVMNEPGGRKGLDDTNWLLVHRQVIRAIRDVAGSQNIIIVEGAFGGQDASPLDAEKINDDRSAILKLADDVLSFDNHNYGNIVFSIHPYDLWNNGDSKMADYFDRVMQHNLAMIVGEYGVQTDPINTTPATQSLFNTAVPRHIGRIVWHWDGSDANDLTTNTSRGGGWEISDCSNPNNLSWLGQQVWNDNYAPASP